MNQVPIKNKKQSKRNLFIAATMAVLLLGGASYALLIHDSSPEKKGGTSDNINYDPPSKEEKQSAEDNKVNALENQPSQQQPATNQKVSITSASQNSSTKEVIIQTELTGRGWMNCNLTLARAGSPTITKQAEALYQPSYSTCAGFSIKQGEFSSGGTWSVNLTVTNSDGTSSKANLVNVLIDL